MLIPNKDETSLELWTQRNKMGQSSMLAIAMSDPQLWPIDLGLVYFTDL